MSSVSEEGEEERRTVWRYWTLVCGGVFEDVDDDDGGGDVDGDRQSLKWGLSRRRVVAAYAWSGDKPWDIKMITYNDMISLVHSTLSSSVIPVRALLVGVSGYMTDVWSDGRNPICVVFVCDAVWYQLCSKRLSRPYIDSLKCRR